MRGLSTEDLLQRLALAPPPALLDVRDERSFALGHLAGSGHVSFADLEPRRAELPPRDAALIVVAESADDALAAARQLGVMGYAEVDWFAGSIRELGAGATECGAAARLWRPSPFLAEVCDAIPRGRAVDLAAGSGREAAFLALAGFDVEAWDEAPEALERAADLARRAGAAITTVRADLEAPQSPLPEARFALVTCFRFLHRPLFPSMARALVPGGHLVYETYRVGQERFGRPKRPQFLLEDGELAREFLGLGLEVLRFDEPGPPEGPVTARLWARRP